jgi:hypothetical protein
MDLSSNILPIDFDWQFYIENHADLQQAGINSEILAIQHYINHGINEQRRYKSNNHYEIQNYINNSKAHYVPPKTKIVLFVQWYTDSSTESNRLKCLFNNIENKHIDHIHVFCEINSHQQLMNYIGSNKKISISFIDDCLSYSDWMEYANQHHINDIKILANSDIYFDDSLLFIRQQKFNYQTIYGITRKDLSHDGKIVDSSDFYGDTKHPTHASYSQDCWIYLQPLRLPDLKLINYKLGYNNCDRLLKKYLEQEKYNFVNLYPNINAIHIDYRTTKTHKSYDLNYSCANDRIIDIKEYLQFNNLQYYHNNLEAIVLLMTGKEIEDGQCLYFIQKLLQSLKNNEANKLFAKLLDFKIIITKHNDLLIRYKEQLEQYFKNISIIRIDIPQQYDFYDDYTETSDLRYGYKSGPNYCFFKAFDHLTMYNTTLFLECDCTIIDNWLERLYNYCRFSGQFWISGAWYDGLNMDPYHSIVNQHINGGSGIYATGNPGFISFIKFCFHLLTVYVDKYSKNLPYDYCIYQIIEDYFNFDHDNRQLWQFIKRNYIHNNIIVNYSNPKDIDIDIKYIINKYNPAILHQKLILN